MPNSALPALTLFFAACGLVALPVSARVIQVGPGEQVKTIAAAAGLARDDDVVEIAPGTYRADVAVWLQKRLTIRGVGQRPVLEAAGRNAEGKAIWVFRNGDFTVQNIEFRGARVADGNGAGIRFEKGRLRVADCAFIDNQNGILTANFADAQLEIDSSQFAQAPQQQSPLPHLLYVGRIGLLRVLNSRFEGGHFGHLLKSRARVSDVRYNLLVDGAGGRASYEADFPNGGRVTLVGNVLGQSRTTENPTVLAYGAEGQVWADNHLRVVHNTFYSEGLRPAWLMRVFEKKFSAPPVVMTRNNLLAGVGVFSAGVAGEHEGNFSAPGTVFGNPDVMDFTLAADSWLRGRVQPLRPELGDLQPAFEQAQPGRITAIQPPQQWAPGAVQRVK